MDARELVRFFSMFTKLPVHINDVADHLKEKWIKDVICFVEVDIDVTIIRGFLYEYQALRAYDRPQLCADIYYGADQSMPWKRLVCCKELVHLLDRGDHATRSRDDVSKLIEEIVLPPTVANILSHGVQTNGDRWALCQALAILFPMDARLNLMPFYQAGTLTDEEIAKQAQIPLVYVAFLMSDRWPRIHAAMIGEKIETE